MVSIARSLLGMSVILTIAFLPLVLDAKATIPTAADPLSIERPKLSPGDFWEYGQNNYADCGSGGFWSNSTQTTTVSKETDINVNGTNWHVYEESGATSSTYFMKIQGYPYWSNTTTDSVFWVTTGNLSSAKYYSHSLTYAYYRGNVTKTQSWGNATYEPPYAYYRFPFDVGRTWWAHSTVTSIWNTNGNTTKTVSDTATNVTAVENRTFTVPAGTFDTVVMRNYYNTTTEPWNQAYSPKAQSSVRSWWVTCGYPQEMVLVKYKSTPPPPPDKTPPKVSAVSPKDGASTVPTNALISITFNEPMDKGATESALAFSPQAPGTATWNADTLQWKPSSDLSSDTDYTITVGAGAKDLAGNALDGNGDGSGGDAFTSKFHTAKAGDNVPPEVASFSPANGATNVPTNVKPSITFSEAMDRASLDAAVSLTPGKWDNLTLSADGRSLTLEVNGGLTPSTSYTVSVATLARDLAGNALKESASASFTTGSGADTTPPTVISTDPAPNAREVARKKAIRVTFSEGMDPVATSNAISISPIIDYDISWDGVTLVMTPKGDGYQSGASVTLTIGTGAKDLAGNTLQNAYGMTFTVEAAKPDGGGTGPGAGLDLMLVAIIIAIVALAVVVIVIILMLKRKKTTPVPSYPQPNGAYQQTNQYPQQGYHHQQAQTQQSTQQFPAQQTYYPQQTYDQSQQWGPDQRRY